MDNNKNEEKINLKEKLKLLDKRTKKNLFNIVVVSICYLCFVVVLIYLALTQPAVMAELVKPTMIGPIMSPVIYRDYVKAEVSVKPELEYPVYRGEKVEFIHPVYRGEPVEFTLLSNK